MNSFPFITSLIRDWLFDPTALLFLMSLLWGIVLTIRARRARRALQEIRGGHDKAGCYRQRSKWPWIFSFLWLSVWMLMSAPMLVNPLIVALENRHQDQQACEKGSHIVLLGGGVDSRIRIVEDFSRLRPATFVRATEAARLLKEEPNTRLVVAGGASAQIAEADVIAEYLMALGVPKSRLLLENQSVNTAENARNVSELLTEETVNGPVRLITSAMHMHRALGAFTKAVENQAISLCPVRVDFKGLPFVEPYAWMPQTTALQKFDLWLHEQIAIQLYRFRGWM